MAGKKITLLAVLAFTFGLSNLNAQWTNFVGQCFVGAIGGAADSRPTVFQTACPATAATIPGSDNNLSTIANASAVCNFLDRCSGGGVAASISNIAYSNGCTKNTALSANAYLSLGTLGSKSSASGQLSVLFGLSYSPLTVSAQTVAGCYPNLELAPSPCGLHVCKDEDSGDQVPCGSGILNQAAYGAS